jgi:site-specific DNA recombinase
VRKEIGSGADLNLPELLNLLNRAKSGEYDVLLCLATSRLSRDTVKAGVVKRELQRYGVPVRYVQHTFDPSPTGRLMEHIFEGLDQFEKENIALRFNLGKQRKARFGMVVGGGRVPYGYRRVVAPVGRNRRRVTVGLEQDPETAPIVRRIASELLTRTIQEVCERLDADGVPTPYGQSACWSPSSVVHILDNTALVGVYRYGNYTYIYCNGKRTQVRRENDAEPFIPLPAILTPDELQKTREALVARKRQHSRRRTTTDDPYTLRGMLVCGLCGGQLACTHNNGYIYYTCLRSYPRTARLQGHEGCSLGAVNVEKMNRHAWEYIMSTLLDPDHMRGAIHAARRSDAETVRKRDRIADCKAEVERLRKRLDRQVIELLDAEPGSETAASLKRAASLTERDIRANQHMLEELEAVQVPGLSDNDAEALEHFAATIREGIEAATPAERRRIYELLRLHVIVQQGTSERAVTLGRNRFDLEWQAVVKLINGTQYVRTPGTEQLYSGVAISSASAVRMRSFNSRTGAGSPAASTLAL